MAKLNKEQLKKLYDYGGTLSSKDWADMIDSVVPDTPDIQPGTVIETTYEEAKSLYESGQMKQGVYYKFPYRSPYRFRKDDEDSNSWVEIFETYMYNENYVYIYVFIDSKSNTLKAKCDIEGYSNQIYNCIADYSFDCLYFTNSDRNFVSEEYKDNIVIGPFDYSDSMDILINKLREYDVKFIIDMDIINIDEKSILIYTDLKMLLITTKFIFEIEFEYDNEIDYDIITNISVTNNTSNTGLITNLDFGSFKQTYLSIYYSVSNDSIAKINILCDVDNNYDEVIYTTVNLGTRTISRGSIIHSNIIFDKSYYPSNNLIAYIHYSNVTISSSNKNKKLIAGYTTTTF